MQSATTPTSSSSSLNRKKTSLPTTKTQSGSRIPTYRRVSESVLSSTASTAAKRVSSRNGVDHVKQNILTFGGGKGLSDIYLTPSQRNKILIKQLRIELKRKERECAAKDAELARFRKLREIGPLTEEEDSWQGPPPPTSEVSSTIGPADEFELLERYFASHHGFEDEDPNGCLIEDELASWIHEEKKGIIASKEIGVQTTTDSEVKETQNREIQIVPHAQSEAQNQGTQTDNKGAQKEASPNQGTQTSQECNVTCQDTQTETIQRESETTQNECESCQNLSLENQRLREEKVVKKHDKKTQHGTKCKSCEQLRLEMNNLSEIISQELSHQHVVTMQRDAQVQIDSLCRSCAADKDKDNNAAIARNNNNDYKGQDPEEAIVRLGFLKRAIFYFLTDKDNCDMHLKAIQEILNFSPFEKNAVKNRLG